jgi:uncharacterized integral membrane protein
VFFQRHHLRPADFTATLFAVALLALYVFATGPTLARLTARASDWPSVVIIILGFFGLGLLLHSAEHATRRFLHRARRFKA